MINIKLILSRLEEQFGTLTSMKFVSPLLGNNNRVTIQLDSISNQILIKQEDELIHDGDYDWISLDKYGRLILDQRPISNECSPLINPINTDWTELLLKVLEDGDIIKSYNGYTYMYIEEPTPDISNYKFLELESGDIVSGSYLYIKDEIDKITSINEFDKTKLPKLLAKLLLKYDDILIEFIELSLNNKVKIMDSYVVNKMLCISVEFDGVTRVLSHELL